MEFNDHRKLGSTHLYYVYVFAKDDKPARLIKTGKLRYLLKQLRDQQRNYDVVKVW